jgi:hypothetical protein
MSEANAVNTKNPSLFPMTSPAADDAAVIRLCDEILAGFAESARVSHEGRCVGADWAAVCAISAHVRVARAKVVAMSAATIEGWKAKARVLAHQEGRDDALAWSLARDLLAASA